MKILLRIAGVFELDLNQAPPKHKSLALSLETTFSA
jgi:hypothetical protein